MELTASPLRRTAVSCAVVAAALVFAAGSAAANTKKWGAISISQLNGVAVASWNYNSQADAEAGADAACDRALTAQPSTGSSGGVEHDCEAKVFFYSGYCAAVAQATDGSWSWGWAQSRTDAANTAIRNAAGPRPTVLATACQS
jgi:hypothetical protein